jgi:hypothetical protein
VNENEFSATHVAVLNVGLKAPNPQKIGLALAKLGEKLLRGRIFKA